ncbi:hypothetical protein ROZALSC1DRAFT_29379, partial [Rozella allomycis CSF55]
VFELHKKLEEGVPVSVILDGLRGTRRSINRRSSYDMLLPLSQKFDHFKASFLKCPKMDARGARWIPERFNEVFGIMHMKACIFDDTLVLTGANLSSIYFQNRVDRYAVFQNSTPLADFYAELLDEMSEIGNCVSSSGSMTPTLWKSNHSHNYRLAVKNKISEFINKERTDLGTGELLVPPFGIDQYHQTILQCLANINENQKVLLSAGYFNLIEEYTKALLNSGARVDLLVASPSANGFYNASGLSKHIPSVYSLLERKFMKTIRRAKCDDRIRLYEFDKQGYSFHAKGLWIFDKDGKPFLSTIGSPNLGYRSAYRDMESQVFLKSDNDEINAAIVEDARRILEDSYVLTEEDLKSRHIPAILKCVTPLIKTML